MTGSLLSIRVDSRIDTPMKDAISLKITIAGMKRASASLVNFLMRCGSAVTISAFVKR